MRKDLKISAIIFSVLILGALVYLLFPKSYIKLSVAPSTMTLKIDNGSPRNVKTGQTILVIAGTHSYTFNRDGFAPMTVKLNSGNNETKEILEVFTPLTPAAIELLKNDKASYDVQERVGGVKESKAVSQLNKDYPIVNKLPIYNHSLSIEACPSKKYPNDPAKIALCINLAGDTPASAVDDYITSLGYKPEDYEIIIQNLPQQSQGGNSDSD